MAICPNVSKCNLLEQFNLENADLREIWFSRYCSVDRGKKCEYKKIIEHANRFNVNNKKIG